VEQGVGFRRRRRGVYGNRVGLHLGFVGVDVSITVCFVLFYVSVSLPLPSTSDEIGKPCQHCL